MNYGLLKYKYALFTRNPRSFKEGGGGMSVLKCCQTAGADHVEIYVAYGASFAQRF